MADETTETNIPLGDFPGSTCWDRAGELMARADFRPTRWDAERTCFLGGEDPLDPLIETLCDVTPAGREARADRDAYLGEWRLPNGMTEGDARMPPGMRARVSAASAAHEAARGAVSLAVERLLVAAVLEALAIAGHTDPLRVADIARRVVKGA
jgi:hypothetical protein